MKDMTACREILTTPLWVLKCCQLKNWAVWANWSNSDRLPLCFHVFSLNQKPPKRIHVFNSMSGKGGEEGRLYTFAALFIINLAGWRNLWEEDLRSLLHLPIAHRYRIWTQQFPDSHIVTACEPSDCHWGQSQYSLSADMNSTGSWAYRPEFISNASNRQTAGSAIQRKPYCFVGFFFLIIIRKHLPLPQPKENKGKAFLNLAVNISAPFCIIDNSEYNFWWPNPGSTFATL